MSSHSRKRASTAQPQAHVSAPGLAATRPEHRDPLLQQPSRAGLDLAGDDLAERRPLEQQVATLTRENDRLLEETRRLQAEIDQRAAEQAVISAVQQGLASKLDMQAIIDLVGDKLCEVLGTDSLTVRLYDPQTDLVSFPYMVEEGRRVPMSPMAPSGLSAYILRTCQPLLINENSEARFAELNMPTLPGTQDERALAAVPIMTGGQPVGLISVSNYERENALSESDVRMLMTLAASLSVALENVRLFEQTRGLLAETEQRAGELAVISSVRQALASQLEERAIVDLVGDKLCEVLRTQDLLIRLYDPQTDLVTFPYLLDQGRRLQCAAQPPNYVARQVLTTREPLIVNANMEGFYTQHGSVPLAGTDMEKSAVWVPIIGSGQALGLVSVCDYERENAFAEADIRMLTTIAGSLGVALENVRLLEQRAAC